MHIVRFGKDLLPLISTWLLTHERLTAFGVGIVTGLPFVFPVTTPVAYGAIIVYTLVVTRTPTSVLVVTLPIVFFAKALVVLSIIFATLPLDWLGDFPLFVEVIVLSFYWVIAALALGSAGLFLVCGISLYRRYMRRLPTVLIPVTAAVGVVIAEYVGALVFSIVMLGVGGYISADFSFGHIGYLFPWLYPLAKGAGVYTVGIGGMVVLTAIAVFLSLRRMRYLTPLVFVMAFFILGYTHLEYDGTPVQVALVETNERRIETGAEDAMKAYGQRLETLVMRALESQPDYIILPEDSRYLVSHYAGDTVGIPDAVAAWSIIHSEATSTIVIDSARTLTASGPVQRATIWRGDTILATADKQYLVPQGEYMPAIFQQIFSIMGLRSVIARVSDDIAYVSGTAMLPESPEEVPSLLFCFESVAPAFAYELNHMRPQSFIVHPMSHAWFHSPHVVQRQLDTMLRFQAVWAGVPIVSVGNMVEGKVYTPTGTIVIPETIETRAYGSVRLVTVLRPD